MRCFNWMHSRYNVETIFLFVFSFFVIFLTSYYSMSREVSSDMEVYYLFYQRLEQVELFKVTIGHCYSFEPLFCISNAALIQFISSVEAVHYFWVSFYYSIIFLSIYKLSKIYSENEKININNFTIFMLFLFTVLNAHHPAETPHLIRQYVAASLLLYTYISLLGGKTNYYSMLAAFLIHFASIPFVLILFLLSSRGFFKRNKAKTLIVMQLVIVLLSVILLLFYAETLIYVTVVRKKIEIYASMLGGGITLSAEIKVIIMFLLAAYTFKGYKNASLYIFMLFSFYILTFASDMMHFRYYKYLIVLLIPFVFIFFTDFFKGKGFYFIFAATLYRVCSYIWKYGLNIEYS